VQPIFMVPKTRARSRPVDNTGSCRRSPALRDRLGAAPSRSDARIEGVPKLPARCREGSQGLPPGRPGQPSSSACFEAFGFTGHGLHKFAQACRDNCWIKDHLPGHVAQTAATRAFNALLQYAVGRRGRPRFMYDSIEGKEVKSTIIWRDGCVWFAGMVIAAILDPAYAWQCETLKSPTSYCRVIRRQIRGRCRWLSPARAGRRVASPP
jgi:hypothetical protein